MTTDQSIKWRLLTLITDTNKRGKVEAIMEHHGPLAFMSMLAKGTTRKSWLRQLGIKESGKMHFEFLLSPEREAKMLQVFTEELRLGQPGQGVAFSTEVLFHISASDKLDRQELLNFCQGICQMEDTKGMYKKICVIVDLGLGDDVIEAAREAGVKGGTILRGHGSAKSEHAKLFGFQIVPEKEMVIMLTPNHVVQAAISAINDQFKLDGVGNGILYVQDVLSTQGLFESTIPEA